METNTSTKYKGTFIFYRKEGGGGGGAGRRILFLSRYNLPDPHKAL